MRTGSNWGWLYRLFVQCLNDTLPVKMWNLLNQRNDTYGLGDIRGSGNDTTINTGTGAAYHHCNIYLWDVYNGDQGNNNVYHTCGIFYGSLANNKAMYAWNLFQWNHHQYDGYADSISIENYGTSGSNNMWIGSSTFYAANPIGYIIDTTATWIPESAPLLTGGLGYPQAQGSDLYGVSTPNSIYLGAITVMPSCNCIGGNPRAIHSFNNKTQQNENHFNRALDINHWEHLRPTDKSRFVAAGDRQPAEEDHVRYSAEACYYNGEGTARHNRRGRNLI